MSIHGIQREPNSQAPYIQSTIAKYPYICRPNGTLLAPFTKWPELWDYVNFRIVKPVLNHIRITNYKEASLDSMDIILHVHIISRIMAPAAIIQHSI